MGGSESSRTRGEKGTGNREVVFNGCKRLDMMEDLNWGDKHLRMEMKRSGIGMTVEEGMQPTGEEKRQASKVAAEMREEKTDITPRAVFWAAAAILAAVLATLFARADAPTNVIQPAAADDVTTVSSEDP